MTDLVSANALDIIFFSMLLSLLLASKTIFLLFFLFLTIAFKNNLTIPLLKRNTRLILAHAIRVGGTIALANEKRETLLAPDKTNKVLSG